MIICEQKHSVVEWWWVEKIGKVIANIGTPQSQCDDEIHIKTLCDGYNIAQKES